MSKLVVAEIEDAAGANPYSITLTAEQATTSNSSIIFGSIPAGTKRITIMLDQVSTSGTSNRVIQIGDSSGIETSGYVGSVSRDSGATTNFSASFIFETEGNAAIAHTGIIELCLEDSSGFTWIASGNIADPGSTANYFLAGSKSLSAELTQISLTTAGGSDTFDAGVASIQFQ